MPLPLIQQQLQPLVQQSSLGFSFSHRFARCKGGRSLNLHNCYNYSLHDSQGHTCKPLATTDNRAAMAFRRARVWSEHVLGQLKGSQV